MSEHIPEAAVEATGRALQRRWEAEGLADGGTSATLWDELTDEDRESWLEWARVALAAALPHLVTEAAIGRVIHTLYDCDLVPEGPHRDNAQAIVRAALGIQDEQEVGR